MPKEIEYAIKGYQQFRKKYFNKNNDLFKKLKKGQFPKMLVIACSDSRVDPTIIMDCKPGDLFVIRNVANLVPPYENDDGYHGTSAALEFGVCGLGIRHIIILGHSQCGGIASLMQDQQYSNPTKGFIGKWMAIAATPREETKKTCSHLNLEGQLEQCTRLALLNSHKNLLTFPWINNRVEEQNLFLHCWYFDIASGTIQAFNEDSKKFEEL